MWRHPPLTAPAVAGRLSTVRIGLVEADGVFSFVATGADRRESQVSGSGPSET